MKRLLKKYMLCLFAIMVLSVFAACSSEDDSVTGTTSQTREALQLTVSTGDFVTDGAPDTRATDNGKVTTFENGDRIGLIILKNNGNDIVADNVPYKYDGSNWAFDANNGDTKSVVYYDNGIGNVTYIAYFPYSKEADGATTVDKLKSKFRPQTDQSSEANYRASDLMVWESGDPSEPQKKLDIALAHAYASVSLSPTTKYTLEDGNSTDVYCISSEISDVSFTVGNDVCLPFQSEDGSFRCILPAGTSGTVRWFYTFEGETYGSSRDLGSGATANTRYVRQETIKDKGKYSLDKARIGDFYCKNDKGEGYLVPGDVISLPDAQKADCIGIVFFGGQHETDDTDYSTTGILQKQCHGYAVALKDAGSFYWKMVVEVGTSNINNDWKGYFNQTKIKEYADNNSWEMSDYFHAANACAAWGTDGTSPNSTAYEAPMGSSGWFLPSAGQLRAGLYDNKAAIESFLTKTTGDTFGSNQYWSSSEYTSSPGYPGHYAYSVDFSGGNVESKNKGFDKFQVRAVLAF